ncbi:hypothetical protein H6P81_015764 [Aristolochia fimbriata]|uniref:Dof zinc finger protein n=1 Tax=Aristolochia fimbriata TaxID=158543 RepID=A0AAV7E6P4_ARIFI|nr:hypothetical protein H6P81_015764 [Aristolochia fimbriata]
MDSKTSGTHSTVRLNSTLEVEAGRLGASRVVTRRRVMKAMDPAATERSREKLLPCAPRPLMVDRRWKTTVEMAPNCPRCDSSNTKFCYYNNYSLTQPRYFCKGCRRYWTKGGSLRNVPVGGGCRKNRRGKSLRQVSSSDHHNRCSSVGMGTYGRGCGGGGAGGGEQSSATDSVGSFSQSSSDVGGSGSASSTTDASTIDLAVVYAKFLNQGPVTASFVDAGTTAPELQNEFNGGDGSFELSTSNGYSNDPGYHSPVQFSGDHSVDMECSFGALPVAHLGHHHPREYDPQFTNNPPQHDRLVVDDHQLITSLVHPMTNYSSVGELQSVAVPSSDDTGCFQVEEETLWSGCLMEPNFTPNPHGLETMIEDHLALQPNFLNATTNWSTDSSFDLSAYDAFTRP